MSERQIREALNNCIDRLADGQNLEDCLEAYPEFTHELRPLLEIGQAASKNRANFAELTQMHSRLDTNIENLIAATDFDSPSPFRLPQGVTVLVASLVVVAIGITLFISGSDNSSSGNLTETDIATAEITLEANDTATLEATSELIVTAEITLEASDTATIEPIATLTSTVEITVEPSQTPECAIPSDWFEYQIRAGDSLSQIAVNTGISIETLREANCLGESTIIIAGQKIYVPHLWNDANAEPDESGEDVGSPSNDDEDDSDDDEEEDNDDD